MPQIISGQSIANEILSSVAARVAPLAAAGHAPLLAVVLVGDDKPSHTYVQKKGEAAKAVGLDFFIHTAPETITTDELIRDLAALQAKPELAGLIVQLPLPKHVNTHAVLNAIDEAHDIDSLSDLSLGRLATGHARFVPPTVGAIMAIIEREHLDISGKEITIVGAGPLVGKPLAATLMNMNATVTICNSSTTDLAAHTRRADILVTGVGKKHLIDGTMVKPGALVIDAGVQIVDGKSYGDVDPTTLDDATKVTPTPGGVGPITVAKLLENTLLAATYRA
jgi:methylenetetrahydrofolate dehydrogenase (NADP+)/methenyltetrahydrofolate cyclohydrolase